MATSFQLTADSTTPRALGDGTYGPDLSVQNLGDVPVWLRAMNATPADCAAVAEKGTRIAPGTTWKSNDPNGHPLMSYWVATESGTADVRVIC